MSTDPMSHLDVAFIVDTTGSMGPFIQAAREHMVTLLRRVTADSQMPIDLRVAIVEYRDHPPQDMSFVTREYAFTDELASVQKVIAKLAPNGGGDEPEAVFDGIEASAHRLEWRPHSRRMAILIGDARPHGWAYRGNGPQGACACGMTVDSATAALEQKCIVLYALGLTASVDAPFTWLARATGGSYFAAHQGQAVMPALEELLAREFADLDFDRRVRDGRLANAAATVDELAAALESPPGRVAASLSRIGRRGLLPAEPATPAPARE
jgi:Mg-chelatase subunit ChlD